MGSKRPLILVTNDDSISSKGIASLYKAVQPFGDVVVIAPDSPQSGMGHAITINDLLRLEEVDALGGIDVYSCSGTPVDCVKLGISEVMHRKPDLIVSGINHGANTATNVLYSGTMSAAIEGAMEGIPSIGFSLDSFDSRADFSVAMFVVGKLVAETLKNGIPKWNCLNVNIPNVDMDGLNGIKVCRQANASWEDRFDKRLDQHNRTYYWLTGDFVDQEKQTDTDVYWISKGFATVVPTQFDMTAYDIMEEINNWNI